MEYYTAEKNNDILKVNGWIQKKTFSEVTQTQKDKYNMYFSQVTFSHKEKNNSLQFTTPENLDNKENPKRDIYGSNLHGKQKKTRSPE